MTPDPTPDTAIGPSAAPNRPRRRWWRVALSLRALMLVVLLVGGLLGWQARRASIQRRAVAQIKVAGGGVIFDFQAPEGKPWQMGATPPGPAWLRRVIGDEPFQSPRWALIENAGPKGVEPTDPTIAAIASLDELENLNIYHSQLTDAQFARLTGLQRLKSLTLLSNRQTTASLTQIAQCTRLESLVFRLDQHEPAATILPIVANLTGLKELALLFLEPVEAADLDPLRRLTHLESLHLHQSPADDSCLDALSGLIGLKRLTLGSTQVTDAGLRRLAGLRNLTQFMVGGAAITDDGLAIIAGWRSLETLYLVIEQPDQKTLPGPYRSGQLTDRGLTLLAQLPNLETVAIAGRFTDAGLIALAAAPKLSYLELNGIEGTTAGLNALVAGHQFQALALSGPAVADDWAPALAGQTRLQAVTLAGPSVTDAALASLPLGSLRQLSLPGTRLTDAGLRVIAARAPALQSLDIQGTAVTTAGLAALRRVLPRCTVKFEPSPAGP